MDINKLSLKAYYEANKENYRSKRLSGDDKAWDESYKWKILPRLNDELKQYKEINPSNASEIVKILQKK